MEVMRYKTMIVITSIKEIPEFCTDCPIRNSEHSTCDADVKKRAVFEYRPYWCPLKEVKEKENNNVNVKNLVSLKKIEIYKIEPVNYSPTLEMIKECVRIASENNCLVRLEWDMWDYRYSRYIKSDDDPEEFYNKRLPNVYGM